MLTEEALILLATVGASGLLALGVVELAWPSTPRRPARRARVASPVRLAPALVGEPLAVPEEERVIAVDPPPLEEPTSIVEPVASAATEAPAAEVGSVPAPVAEPAPPRRAGLSSRGPRAPRASELRRASAPPVIDGPVAEFASAPVEEPVAREGTPEPEPARPRVLPVDTCLAMYNDGRFAEVVSLGSAALEVHARLAAVSDRPDEASALLDLVGLSKQELGDHAGARAAFRAAIRDAGPQVRPTYVGHLVTLARGLAGGASDPADAGVETGRVGELRACAVALDDALATVPGDETVIAAQAAVRDALAAACERLVARVVSGEADDHARANVVEVLADDAMPAAWRERLREQLAAASSAEIGQLTAQAIRSVQDGKDGEALETLERAERLAAALPSGAVADERREELDRRLWWGYTKVGLRRVETENFEGALEPLFRALHLGGIDEERLAETRGALVRALDGVVDTRGPGIQQLAAGDVSAAKAEIAKLAALLRSATERGLTVEDLGDAFAKVALLG